MFFDLGFYLFAYLSSKEINPILPWLKDTLLVQTLVIVDYHDNFLQPFPQYEYQNARISFNSGRIILIFRSSGIWLFKFSWPMTVRLTQCSNKVQKARTLAHFHLWKRLFSMNRCLLEIQYKTVQNLILFERNGSNTR